MNKKNTKQKKDDLNKFKEIVNFRKELNNDKIYIKYLQNLIKILLDCKN
jgi:hypothetical protein